MAKLAEVFGVSTTVPKYTYVDRLGLDGQFRYFLEADRHLVVHGGSKQGKTILRRKHLADAECIVLPCGLNDTLESLYARISRETVTTVVSSSSKATTTGGEGGANARVSMTLPFVAEASAGVGGKVQSKTTHSTEEKHLGADISIDTVARAIRHSHRRLVIEDFHYLAEDEQKKLAFALKALWDAKVFVIIIGIWAEQNLLTVYNNDLSGRVEEIDVRWTDEELRQVISKGENILNVTILPEIVDDIIKDANKNVGLLQRLAEGACLEAGITETRKHRRTLDDWAALNRCREAVCKTFEHRYFSFASFVSRGFKNPEKTKLKLYRQIIRACIEATEAELVDGLERQTLLTKIKRYEPAADMTNLQKALSRLDRLQTERKITPPVLSYGQITRTVVLVDRELLFYRKYTTRSWPWEDNYASVPDVEEAEESATGPDGVDQLEEG
ncbi:MAG: hypothetical protein WB681_04935 [Candidatus Cybelea sp.]